MTFEEDDLDLQHLVQAGCATIATYGAMMFAAEFERFHKVTEHLFREIELSAGRPA